MIDSGTAALIAASVALVVGSAGIIANTWVAHRNRLAGLQLQYAGERAKAMVRVLQLLETGLRSADNRIFNLTQARREDDPYTGAPGDPYAPNRRPDTERDLAAEAEARALIGAYGDHEMDVAFLVWVQALDEIDEAFDLAEYNYIEQQQSATSGHFAVAQLKASGAHGNLRLMIRKTIRVVPPPRRTLVNSRRLQGNRGRK
ncbi:hypothetical protein [Rathayibacter sp. VKM Ac-2928]|uniref:hypothetical protein n=1 Tax=Rathayibacter sp. VKM Ac-2928 TaxID=2929479 RepID=UPI001FB2E92A|nr:hypothetical protein [Rathayibacter sp. VKM Ac-2928]MCJ1685344.1 hypothetical protein [Rathayibacter sp. VKM Ac-2928]